MTKGKVAEREVICVGCNQGFNSTSPRAKYCSRKCLDKVVWDKKHRKTLNCKQCDQVIQRNYSRDFCSQDCKDLWYRRTGLTGRAYWMIHYYGITVEQFDSMLEKQNGVCAICKQESKSSLHIDHDHNCCPGKKVCGKCVRGLLCSNCNNGLGRFKDSVESLGNAMDYLKTYTLNHFVA